MNSGTYDGSIRINTKIDQSGVKEGIGKMSTSFKKLGGVLAKMFAIKKVIDFGKKSQDAFKIANEAQMKLTSAMRSNLNATNETIEAIMKLTNVEQALGVVEDDVQKAGLAMLSTFVKSTDSLEKMLPAMNNLIAFQYGMESTVESANAVAKAMGRAIGTGELTSLTRMGVVFDEATQEAFKLANETEKVKILSEGITKKIGNINYLLASTDLGRQQQLKNVWGDVQETFGEVITKFAVLFIPMLKKAVAIMDNIGQHLVGIADAFQEVFMVKDPPIVDSAINASEAQEKLADSIEKTNEAVEAGLAGFDQLNVLQKASASEDLEIGGSVGGIEIGEGTQISPDIQKTVQIIKEWIVPVFNKLKEMFIVVGDILKSVYENAIKPLGESIATNILPLIKGLLNNILGLIDSLKPYIDGILEYLTPVIKGIMNLLNGLIMFITGVLSGDLTKAFNGVGDIVGGFYDIQKNIFSAFLKTIQTLFNNWGINIDLENLIKTVGDIFDSAKKVMSNLVDFIKNVFTGNWKGAWDNIKNIFTGIWEYIENFGKMALNGLITALEAGLNFIIEGINAITEGLSQAWTWAGIPAIPAIPRVIIPKLADGAVIQPNNEFLAILGDQKSGVNIETPLNTMVKAFKEALHDMNIDGNSQSNATVIIDGRIVGEIVLPHINNINRNTGKSLVIDRGTTWY